MSNQYTCTFCGETYITERSDEEALDELKENFGSVPVEECGIVCDECYNKVMNFIKEKDEDHPHT